MESIEEELVVGILTEGGGLFSTLSAYRHMVAEYLKEGKDLVSVELRDWRFN